jgi:hypothetical protein
VHEPRYPAEAAVEGLPVLPESVGDKRHQLPLPRRLAALPLVNPAYLPSNALFQLLENASISSVVLLQTSLQPRLYFVRESTAFMG